MKTMVTLGLWLVTAAIAQATTYEVGPGKPYATIGAVPWATLQPGDTVLIHYQPTPYAEKWVICRQGTALLPITVKGVKGPGGERPIIEGNGATTPSPLNYWNEDRGVIKIGGANTPADTMPAYIVVESLDIRGARSANTYTGDDGLTHNYLGNASAIYVEKGNSITVRDCVMHDCGNGFFTASQSSNVLVEGCHIYDNGNSGSIFEHNNYTESNGITFQFNRFGPLAAGASGNNLKDRSAGCVIRYNWIESGNRQLDLVDSDTLYTQPAYSTTHVYGNVLIEPNGAGNSQIVHYGGDSGTTAEYRQGTLHFYNNTVISQRTGNTTLLRLSSNGETADVRNNILYVTAAGSSLGMLDDTGTLNLRNCWIKAGWSVSHSNPSANVVDSGGHVNTVPPGFVDEAAQDFHLAAGSPCIGGSTALAGGALAIDTQYVPHQSSVARADSSDLGAYKYGVIGGGGGGAGGGGGTSSGGGGGKKGGCGSLGLDLMLPALVLLARRYFRSLR